MTLHHQSNTPKINRQNVIKTGKRSSILAPFSLSLRASRDINSVLFPNHWSVENDKYTCKQKSAIASLKKLDNTKIPTVTGKLHCEVIMGHGG
jgi:hypothetical protein